MSDKITEFISEEKIKNRISEIAVQLNEMFKGQTVTVICTLKGAFVFTADLIRQLDFDVRMEFVSATSYRGTESTGKLVMRYPLDNSVEGDNVILVEDILDTGRTMKYLYDYVKEKNPKDLKLVVLLDKPDRRVAEIQADIAGFTIPDKFVVGYGLDYEQKYRYLPYIGVIEPTEEK